MASFLRKRQLRAPRLAIGSLGVCIATMLALCGSASADPVTSLLATTSSQVSSTVAPPTQAVSTVVTDAAADISTAEPAASAATTPSLDTSATAANGALDKVAYRLAKPSPAIHVVGTITKAVGAADEHTGRVVSHTVSRLEQAVTETAYGTQDGGASSSVNRIARNAPHTPGSILADRTSQIIISQPAKDAGDALDLTPATDAQPLDEPRLSVGRAAPSTIPSARAGVSSFILSAHGSAPLVGETASLGLSVDGGGPDTAQHAHSDAPLPGDPVSPAPGGSSSSAIAGAAGSGALIFLALIGLFTLAGPRATRRLPILGDPLRPAPFVLIPQRPG